MQRRNYSELIFNVHLFNKGDMNLLFLLSIISMKTQVTLQATPQKCSSRLLPVPVKFKTEVSQILSLPSTSSRCSIPSDILSEFILARTHPIECIYTTLQYYNFKFECFGQMFRILRKMAVVKQDKRLLRISHMTYFLGKMLKAHETVRRTTD